MKRSDWFGTAPHEPQLDRRPLTPSLPPSDGERVPARVFKGVQGFSARATSSGTARPGALSVPLFTAALMAWGSCVMDLKGSEPAVTCGPLYHEATNEFATMTTTLYQYWLRVDREAGSYKYDCVGFVSYALRQAAPKAWETTVKVTGIAKGRIPSPPRYRAFFADLADRPRAGWEAVTRASELRPGDVVAWAHKTKTSNGHAVVIGSVPVRLPDGAWLVEVYDSTSSPHGDDSRPDDPRAQPVAGSGRHSGLGHGVMVFVVDPVSGALTGVRWSPKAKAITVPIAAGRPTH